MLLLIKEDLKPNQDAKEYYVCEYIKNLKNVC